MAEDDLTIYEVRTCSTCRNLSALLAEQGVEYTGIEYHKTGLTEDEIRALLRKANVTPRDILRMREPAAKDIGPATTDDELIALMAQNPKLVQRPIAVRGDRAVLGRPIERVLELLED